MISELYWRAERGSDHSPPICQSNLTWWLFMTLFCRVIKNSSLVWYQLAALMWQKSCFSGWEWESWFGIKHLIWFSLIQLLISPTTLYRRVFKSQLIYCYKLFHVAEAKIIRHKNRGPECKTMSKLSVPKRNTKISKKTSIRSCPATFPAGVCSCCRSQTSCWGWQWQGRTWWGTSLWGISGTS